tara:strand:+ start:634 stop:963 length:330 start_codon:yes stop_codon:yes gene_type:complete
MKQFLLALFFSFLLAIPVAFAIGEGGHPYDQSDRMTYQNSHRENKLEWGYDEIQRFYSGRYRTYTHMLHPYYRKEANKRYGRIPQAEFNYSYEHFVGEVVRPDRVYGGF